MSLRSRLVAGFALGWSTMVQTADSGHPERLWFLSVLAVGLIGASLARLKAPGLAVTLFAMATTLALIAVILPSGAPPDMARRVIPLARGDRVLDRLTEHVAEQLRQRLRQRPPQL